MKKLLAQIFDLDARSLALFRIVLGSALVCDLLQRLLSLQAFYTDNGIHSRAYMIENSNNARISFYNFAGTDSMVLALFLVHLTFLIFFTIGYRTRLSNIVIWVLTISLHNRNYTILNNGDTLVRTWLFLCIFLPLGNRLAIRPDPNDRPHWLRNIPLFIQITMLYFFTGYLKTGAEWVSDRSAVYFALMLDQFTTPLGNWMVQFYGFLKIITIMTLALELYFPFALYLPYAKKWIRMSLVALFTSFHIGISATMRVGIFSAASIAGWMAFIPSEFWDWIEQKAFFKKWQSFWRSKQLPASTSSLSLKWGVLFYTVLGIGFYYNLSSVNSAKFPINSKVSRFVQTFRFDQEWSMFAPFPLKLDGWNVIEGALENGMPYDVLRQKEGPVNFSKPQDFTQIYPDSRWHKFLTNLSGNNYKDHRLQFGRWICRVENEQRPFGSRLKTFQIYFVEEFTRDHYHTDPPNPVEIWDHWCFK